MKLVGRGRPRVRFDPAEVALLGQLFDDLDDVLEPAAADSGSGHADPEAAVRERLFPAAYSDDASAADEYRDMTEDTLRSERRERIEACRTDIADHGGFGLDDPDVVRRWLQLINDLRLVHGTRLNVSEDEVPEIDPTDPDQLPWLVYHWLSGVQDMVVRAVMG